MVTGLSGCDESMAGLAALFDRGKSTGMDALGRDAVGEFMNYYNAQLLAKISDDGLDLELEPPNVIHRGMIVSAENIYKIPFSLPFGSYEFLLAGNCTIQSSI
jgi:CheY-specific phosphatase CheX